MSDTATQEHTPDSTAGAGPDTHPGTLVGPSRTQLWRAVRGPVALAVLAVLVALLGAVLANSGARGVLDPRSADPTGSRALAVLLRQDGVDVRRRTQVDPTSAGPVEGDSVLVAFPDRLDRAAAQELVALGADLVLVAPSRPEDWVDGVERRRAGADAAPGDAPENAGEGVRPPACGLPAAAAAGSAEVAEMSYTAARPPGGEAVLCYADDGLAALVALVDGEGRRVTILGDPRPLTNDRLDDAGNAALALGLLGTARTLVWLLPPVTASSPQAPTLLLELVPPGLWWALGQVGVAVALAAAWRARRLGPVVPEPLPVVVRAAEATEGRARLYRRFRAAQRAGEALRHATRARLSRWLGLARAAPREALVEAVVRRTGRGHVEIDALLHGTVGASSALAGQRHGHERLTDASLVRLADALDTLESEVRGS